MRWNPIFLLFLFLLLARPTLAQDSAEIQEKDRKQDSVLFDGQTVEDWGWEKTNFGGEGEVQIIDDEIVMSPGFPMTGIHRSRDEKLPKSNYEITLEAKRLEGIDFFCAMTFPVQKSHCTFVVAGWAGSTVGLSCIDDKDASSNDTTRIMTFEDNRWYKIKVQVTDEKISCWLDEQQVVAQEIAGHKISVRGDIGGSRPLGLAAFESKVAYRNIRLRRLETNNSSDEE